jgi:hypothetical protein
VEGVSRRTSQARHRLRSDADDLLGRPRRHALPRGEWHDKYTLPSLFDYYAPSRTNHGSYWYDWTTEDEVEWRNFYQVWFRLINDYKKMGGRITTGSDSGFIYQTYGFGYINEFEMLQEAGLHRSR